MQSFMDDFFGKIAEKKKSLSTHTLKQKHLPKNASRKIIWAFDYEDDGKGNPTFVDFYDGEVHHGFEFYNSKHTPDDIKNFLVKHIQKGAVLFAHNLQYDFNHLAQQLGWGIVDDVNFAGGSNLIRAKVLTLPMIKEEGIELWDSTNYFAGRLAQMGKIVGIEKGDFFEASKDWNDLKKYCRTDTEILWEFVNKFQEMMIDKFQIPIKTTIGQMAMDVFRTHFLHESMEACSQDICLQAYYGGRTEVFYKGKVDEEICVSDVNSMYPYVMTWNYPDTRFLEKSRLETHEFGVGKFKIFVPDSCLVPPLPIKDEDQALWFPKGILEGTWTYHEVRNALDYGCELIQEYSGSIGTNKSKKFFKEYVEDAYDERLQSKASGDQFGVSFWKLFMNNLYGKWCQHILPERLSAFADPKFEETLKRKIGPLYIFEGTREEVGANTNYMWGAYVTSYARIYLHGILTDVHDAGNQLLYCDTDSVMFIKRNQELPYTISKKLGDLDEELFVGGEFITSKGYYLYEQPTTYSHGFRLADRGELPDPIDRGSEVTDFEILGTNTPEVGESYKRGIYLGQDKQGFKVQHYKLASKGVSNEHGLRFHLEGAVKVSKPMKMKTALAKDMKANVWLEEEKRQISQYIKRAPDQEIGPTKPINVSDIPRLKAEQKEHVKMVNKLDENEFKEYYLKNRKKIEKNTLPK